MDSQISYFIRIFKGLSNFKVYHFGSISLRKKKYLKTNNGTKTFLKKWKITPTFFTKHYLRGGIFSDNKIICKSYDGPINEPRNRLLNSAQKFGFEKKDIHLMNIGQITLIKDLIN